MTIEGEVLEYVEPKKASHQANVVRIKTIYPHPDPETTNLELIEVDGYQVVVRKGEFQIGDLAVYIQPDSVVPQTMPFEFIWGQYAGPRYEDEYGNFSYPDNIEVPEKKRRITVRKFRKEWSEGLLLPLRDFAIDKVTEANSGVQHVWFGLVDSAGECVDAREGDDVSDLLGITHYDPDKDSPGTKAAQSHGPKLKAKYPKTLKGWLKYAWYKFTGRGRKAEALLSVPFTVPVYDVDAFKNYKNAFDGYTGNVVVTEKIHGSNARFLYLSGTMYAGSRNQWKAPGAGSVWHKALEQNPWIEEWCRTNEGCALYGEVVPTQGKFDYGCKKGEVKFFAFDIYDTNGKWLSYDDFLDSTRFTFRGRATLAPMLYYGPFDKATIEKLVDGHSWVMTAKHIREGVVVKSTEEKHVRGLGRLQVKIVSNEFLAKDSK